MGNGGLQFNRVIGQPLSSRAGLLLSANSKSTKANLSRAKKLLFQCAAAQGIDGPFDVTPMSSLLVVNLLPHIVTLANWTRSKMTPWVL